MAVEQQVAPRKSVWFRPLRGPTAWLTGLLVTAVIMGLAGAGFEIAGLSFRWAMALTWPVGHLFLTAYQAASTGRWPTARGWFGVAVFAALAVAIAAAVSR